MGNPTQQRAYMPAETPILMADWLVKPLADLRPGDEVVGWTKVTTAERGHLLRTTVDSVHHAQSQLIDVHVVSGNPVRCVRNALWFTNRFPSATDPHRKQYAEVRPGSYLMQFDLVEADPSPADRMLWYYLAGMVDGEGHIGDSSLPITQATDRNRPVWDRLQFVLDKLKISYQTRYDRHAAKANWSPRATAVIRNVRDEYRRLLRYTEPAKAEQIREALWRRPARPVRGRDRITGFSSTGVEDCFAIETASGNFVAWGYGASCWAQPDHCPEGHLLAVRTDSMNKTYRTCTVCPASPNVMAVSASRRAKTEQKRDTKFSADDRRLLTWAADALLAGEAQQMRQHAGITQTQLSGQCRVSQAMISGWETGKLELKGASGVRYARSLAALSNAPT